MITKDTSAWKGKTALFLTAQTISLFGSSLVQYAIVWYITLRTSSGAMLTVSTICGFLPQILVSLFAGAFIDRCNRKTLIMVSDSVIALATLALAILFLSGVREIWLLYVVLAVRSAGTGIQTPAVNAVIPQIVPKHKLLRVNGINSTLSALTMFLSPAAGGLILSVSNVESTFLLDVLTAAAGVGITACIAVPRIQADAQQEQSPAEQIRQGLRYMMGTPRLRNLLLYQAAVMILISPSAFLTPLLVSRTFGPEVFRLTLSEMTYSAGAALGGILIAAFGGFKNKWKTTVTAGIFYGLLMIAIGAAPVFAAYLAVNFLIGITMPCYNAPLTSLIQEKTDASLHGRIFSVMQITTSCALPLGMLLFGPLADRIAIKWLLFCCGLMVVSVSTSMYRKEK